MLSRRSLIKTTLGAGTALGTAALLPAWARSAEQGNLGLPTLTGTQFDLTIDQFPVRLDGRAGLATGINGTLPGPLVRFREGDDITIGHLPFYFLHLLGQRRVEVAHDLAKGMLARLLVHEAA